MVAAFSLAAVTFSPTLLAQEYLHYKWQSGCFGNVINYAANSPAPNEGTIVTNLPNAPAGSWTAGPFGTALTGASVVAPATHNYVDTGWNPGTITGDMTWACWLKMDPNAPTPSLTYVFGTGGTFRIFTGGGGFFLTSGWGGGNVNTVANVQTLARAGWTHIACVLNSTTLTGTYYINGVPETPVTMTAPVNWTGTTFFVGKHSGLTNANIFDLDEFLLVGSALSASEVMALVNGPRGASGEFGSSCGSILSSNGQAPTIGNTNYAVTLSSAPTLALTWLMFGNTRCSLFNNTFPLPQDLGMFEASLTGCQVHVDNDVGVLSQITQNGTATYPFALPPWSALAGYQLYAQALTYDLSSSQLSSSNALAISIGL